MFCKKISFTEDFLKLFNRIIDIILPRLSAFHGIYYPSKGFPSSISCQQFSHFSMVFIIKKCREMQFNSERKNRVIRGKYPSSKYLEHYQTLHYYWQLLMSSYFPDFSIQHDIVFFPFIFYKKNARNSFQKRMQCNAMQWIIISCNWFAGYGNKIKF